MALGLLPNKPDGWIRYEINFKHSKKMKAPKVQMPSTQAKNLCK